MKYIVEILLETALSTPFSLTLLASVLSSGTLSFQKISFFAEFYYIGSFQDNLDHFLLPMITGCDFVTKAICAIIHERSMRSFIFRKHLL